MYPGWHTEARGPENNGACWYAFKQIIAELRIKEGGSGVLKFFYAGEPPYDCFRPTQIFLYFFTGQQGKNF
jgi:hypothetical protein